MKKKILIFGITGSIGQQALECLDEIDLVGFSFYKNIDLAKAIKGRFSNIEIFSEFNSELNTVNSYEDLILKTQPDLVLNAIVGFNGILITKLCLKHHINIALANKESYVNAGWLINKLNKTNPIKIYPVDSEHSSLYELIQYQPTKIKSIIITASGGPFYNLTNSEKFNKSFSDAIKHPNWAMGYKISVDSATLINKFFELVEAYYIFDNLDIKAIYHPQSIVHSIVEYIDGSCISNMSYPDMKIAIDLSLHDFQKQNIKIPRLNFNDLSLSFSEIDEQNWLPIQWANLVIKFNKHSVGVIVSVLDDYLIELFKESKIKFGEITTTINYFVDKYKNIILENWIDIFNFRDKLLSECQKYLFE